MARFRSRVAALSALGVVAAGAVTTATAVPADAATAPTTHVFVTKTHKVHMPAHLRPGVHRFSVRSDQPAAFQLLKPHGCYTKAELAHDVNLGLNGNGPSSPAALRALKRFERHVTLVGGVSSAPGHRGVLWAKLTPGTYWVADTDSSTTLTRNIGTFDVGGPRVAGTMPSGPRLEAVDEATWAPRPTSIPHHGVLTFDNDSTDNHFLSLARIADGKTMADVRAWFEAVAKNDPNAGPPPIDETAPGLDTGVLSPGKRMALRYSLPPGDYVMVCFWPDAEMGGMPHAFMGMYRGITLK